LLQTTSMISLNKPFFGKNEKKSLFNCFKNGEWASGGATSFHVEQLLKNKIKTKNVYLTTSGTAALELAFMTLGVGPGDEVLVPSFTFPTSASSFMRMGATPRFCDVDPETFNVTVDTLSSQWTPKCKGIVVVHYGGRACPMDKINKFAREKRLWVVEDAAHALGSYLNGIPLGNWGDFGAFSFHQTKNLVCGEGGALVCRSNRWTGALETFLEKGTNRRHFLRGEVKKYHWVSLGSSFGLSDLLAALLVPQLNRMKSIIERRRRVANIYLEGLADWEGPWRAPLSDPKKEGNWHIFPVRVPSRMRASWIQWMRSHGVEASSHYEPLHLSPFGKKMAVDPIPLPTTERISKEIIRLPIHPGISQKTARLIIKTFMNFVNR
jgi:dTDP-4-amino-4,6-dideoxygalactose transaminase